MEMGIDDNDFIDEIDDNSSQENEKSEEQTETQELTNSSETDDFLDSVLKDRGINDKSKIKFENEEGEVEEKDWNDLSERDKINIFKSSEYAPETGLDDNEINLINAIRTSGMNPAEYLQYYGSNVVQNYIENSQEPIYDIDLYSDDELFLMDFLSRMGEVTEDEAAEALDRAKVNEDLYKKQVDAIRNEYRQAEQENLMLAQLEQEQVAQQQYALFSDLIVDEINNLTEIQGFDLNMEDEDMQTLYDFITGLDAAGNNYLVKALSDPRILVKTAWLALNGDQMVQDITNYFLKEITNVRKESYKKGVEDTQKKISKGSNVVFKKTQRASMSSDDIDEF